MSLVMRLRQQGRKNKRTFRMVVADKRSPRDGKYIESVGHYDPHQENGVVLNKEKIEHWFSMGVQPSEKIKCMLKRLCPETLKVFEKKKAK